MEWMYPNVPQANKIDFVPQKQWLITTPIDSDTVIFHTLVEWLVEEFWLRVILAIAESDNKSWVTGQLSMI